MIKNKKALLGSEFIIWFFRLILLTMICTGIILLVYSLYSNQYDVREIEANLLASKFADCLTKNKGIISEEDIANVFDSCNLKVDLDDNYVNITLQDGKMVSNFLGEETLWVLCEVKKKVKQKYPPACITKNYLVLEKAKDGKIIPTKLKIFVAILKIEKNV